MLGNINTTEARASGWTVVPGRECTVDYNANGQPVKETYYNTDGSVVFAINYTYNANNKVSKITFTQS